MTRVLYMVGGLSGEMKVELLALVRGTGGGGGARLEEEQERWTGGAWARGLGRG